MINIKIAYMSLLLFLLPVVGNWTVDSANAKITFTVKGPFGTVHGRFTGLKATIEFDEKSPSTASLSATIDAKTVNTGTGMRDRDLRNEEQWLNTDKFPVISYESKKIDKSGTGYKALGSLTMKGVTKPVSIPFTLTSTGSQGVFKGSFQIKREDFNVGKQGGSVGSLITISLEIPAKK